MTASEIYAVTNFYTDDDHYIVVRDAEHGTFRPGRCNGTYMVGGISLPGVTWEDIMNQEVIEVCVCQDRDSNTYIQFIVDTSRKVLDAYFEGRIQPIGYYPLCNWGGYIIGEVDGIWYYRVAGANDEKWREYGTYENDGREWAFDRETGKEIFPMDEVMRCGGGA